MQLRLARNKDGNQIINLIKRCFNDYKNCYLDVDNDSPELRNVYSYFKNKKGKFWVYVDKNKIDYPDLLKEGENVTIIINTEDNSPLSVDMPLNVVLVFIYQSF